MATGFHGFHVTIGTLFLLYVALAVSRGQVTYSHHFCFEAAA
jgi:cytochrome c oxidase subunit 3